MSASLISAPAQAERYECPAPADVRQPGSFAPQATLTVTGKAQRVLSLGDPGTGDLRRGFEGGTVVSQGGMYHLFTTELTGAKGSPATQLGHWTSPDLSRWTRKATIFKSNGDQTGDDGRAALWAPMPVFDPDAKRWNLFYVGYYSKMDTTAYFYNYDGYLIRAVSETPGEAGIDGPYKDAGVILRPSKESDPWEGLQGTDSIFVYRTDKAWMAFYGSAHTEKRPPSSWDVGLAANPALGGGWRRCTSFNPVPIETHFIENPVVTSIGNLYLAVYDIDIDDPHSIGYATSIDGLVWSKGGRLDLGMGTDIHTRTPLGVLREKDGTYTLMLTARDAIAKGSSEGAQKVVKSSSLYRIPLTIKSLHQRIMVVKGPAPQK